MKPYCTQNQGDCETCALVNYGLDCRNNPVGKGGAGRGQGRKPSPDPRKIRSIAATDGEWKEIKIRAKAAKKSLGEYLISRALGDD